MSRNAARQPESLRDDELVEMAIGMTGPVRRLAEELKTSERTLAAARRGDGLPEGFRAVVLEFVKNDGKPPIPPAPMHQGRRPAALPKGGNLRVRLTAEEILAFEAQADRVGRTLGEAFTEAVESYLVSHPVLDRDLPFDTAGTVGYRCRIQPATLEKLNQRCGYLDWRRVYLRAAVLEWTEAMEQRREHRRGEDAELQAVA